MSLSPISPPAFGEADLSNCEREQIHRAGSIQPHGVLLVMDEPDLVVLQASANAASVLGLDDPPIGRALGQVSAELDRRVRQHLTGRLDRIPVAFRCKLEDPQSTFDGLLHRPSAGGLVVELEPAQPHLELVRGIDAALTQLTAAPTLSHLCDETARLLKDITGYDRVMVYRFDEAGHGQVFAEQRDPELEPYLGNRYPASDIPQIARRLYMRNRVRLLVDVDYVPVPIEPRFSPLTGEDLDMSLCALRSMSPIHIQYLKNMGVAATLVVSLMAGDKLWGLIACHHYSPRFVPHQVRDLCELLGEVVATRIAALESFARARAELSVRRLEHRMVEAISRDGDWKAALFESPQALLQPLQASGAALLLDGELLSIGEVPSSDDLRAIARWLDGLPRAPVSACACLGEHAPQFVRLRHLVSGVMAVPLSARPGDYLIWLRPEQMRTLVWAGNPFKPVEIGDDPKQLSPRRSFEQWRQLVEGTSEHWSAADQTTARLIGESVADVIQQFRAVRILLVQDQLRQVRSQVHDSDQPMVVADRDGSLLVINEALLALLPEGHDRPRSLEALTSVFEPAEEVALRLQELLGAQRPWRGEVMIRVPPVSRSRPQHGEASAQGVFSAEAEAAPCLIRADPVLSAPGQALGYVLLLTEIGQRRRADSARRRFQAEVFNEPPRSMGVPLASEEDLLYRNLFAGLVRNAQLAALEITDGVDLEQVPEMLGGVQASVSRVAELLEHLIWYEHGSAERPH